jgi:hypothetical protein
MSQSQFQSSFGFSCWIPVSENICRKRLALAAFDLIAGAKVIDMAQDTGIAQRMPLERLFKPCGLQPSKGKLRAFLGCRS